MSKDAMQKALEAMERYQVKRQDFDRFADEITALREALAEQPAQQEPRIDIYRSFEQWKSGNVLEHGVPRTEFYTKADLDLVEMGWRYGYDAGRAVEQALDKKAENARELGLDYEPAQQEPVAWLELLREARDNCQASIVEEGISASRKEYRIGLEARLTATLNTSPPAQRTWVGLTDEEVMVAAYQAGFDIHEDYENEDDPEAMHWWTPDGEACDDSLLKLRDLIEAKLKEKNT